MVSELNSASFHKKRAVKAAFSQNPGQQTILKLFFNLMVTSQKALFHRIYKAG